ncbi:methyl-accepting chemotaxis protein [Marinobacter zhanjiangensis]|uniref:Methyl-accepting chemotaxis protein n=1 Tax=Marinobacter zhanjiangensis TaxID=578215 RepID=A0ABQ3AM64_9GAMM|nr:methyl-accepting chemotaxis protein [Marinobacter zhanjiangensis]GGY58804.1 methyl-accepting chemotaxis protein [Marinobacter zhanjiangensis]
MQSSSASAEAVSHGHPSASDKPSGVNRWLPSPTALLLIVLQVALVAVVAWLSSGTVALIAVVLSVAVVALAWYLGIQSRRDRSISQVFERALGQQIDLSEGLTANDDSEEARALRAFNKRLREMILDFQHQSISISLSSARSRLLAELANRDANGQQSLSEQIFQASNETTTALQEISGRTTTITEMNTRNLDVARESSQQLEEARFQVETINNAMGEFQQNIARLEDSSGQIQKILGTVQDFSEQTNMLALNAAIEAARAGEQGRGFAVVADEVRNLSVRVGEAASQIGSLLEEMINAMSGAGNQAQSIMTQSATAGESVKAAAGQFGTMVNDFTQAHEDLLMVSSSLEQLTATNTETHGHASEIRDRSEQIREGMTNIYTQADALRDNTNLVLQALCRFNLGEGPLESMTNKLFARRDQLQEIMEDLRQEGYNLFDFNYKEIPDTGGQKFSTSWNEALGKRIQPLLDEWDLGGKDGIIYTLPTDHNGYLPIARSASAQPMTGDPKVDAARSVHKRITVRGQELENLRKCTYLSMGTFVLPGTTNVVLVIYVPLYVDGKKWGVMTSGIVPKAVGVDK